MTGLMTLRLITPTATLLDLPVRRIVAQAPNGSFGVLPRHVDFVSELVASVMIYVPADGRERFLGINQGTFVKVGDTVQVATRDAIEGEDLATLEDQVARAFLHLDEHERTARSALARLEAGIVRRFLDLERRPM